MRSSPARRTTQSLSLRSAGVAVVMATLVATSAAHANPAAMPRLQLTPLVLGQSATPPAGNGLDFDLLGDTPKAPERSAAEIELDRQEHIRRKMLNIHQIAGLTTLALLAATVVIGQLEYQDHFQPGAPNTAKWEMPHEVMATLTLVGFAGTGALGLFAPVPYPRKQRVDTTFVHKLAMSGAALGMMTELGLGLYTAGHEGFASQSTLAQAHNIIGYTTLGLMSIGASAFIF